MKRLTVRSRAVIGTTVLCLASVLRLDAQTTAPAPTGQNTEESEETLVLSPFVVDASEDADGYAAKSTLAGTRVRTELRDVASAISVVTQQFLQDTGARKSEDLLVYTTNTEVGGIRGNFSGAGGGATYNEAGNLLRPSNNTRVRGLDSADNTRDYFLTEIPWDGYNVGRVDLQRGPNSILFGVGSPAGIINTSLNTAAFKNSNKVENRIDKWGSLRNTADFNYVVLKNELAVRLSLLDDKAKYEQDHAYNHDRRVFGALRYSPKIFGEGSETTIRANYEQGNVHANRPRSLPPIDGLTPWFTYANKLLLNPNIDNATNFGLQALFNESFIGRQYGPTLAIHYDNPATGNASRAIQAEYTTVGGINSTGALDNSINGIPFFRYFALNTNNAYKRASGAVGGSYYVNISMDDPSVFNFYEKLIDGPNKREWQSWDAGNLSVAQTFFDNQLGMELVYDYQRYDDGQVGFLGGDQYVIGVDINTHLIGGGANPNVGRPFVSNNSQYGNTSTFIDRDSIRFTTTGEVRTDKFFGKNFLTNFLGRHVFTGLVSKDTKRTETRGWTQLATEPLYSQLINQNGQNGIPNPSPIIDNGRQINFITYIGPDLRGRSNATGLDLSAVTGFQQPPDVVNARYFDSRWNASLGVNPADPYTFMSQGPGATKGQNNVVNTSTQSENPANYYGWSYRNIRVMNADKGDLDQLYSDGTKSKNVIKSKGITWQGYMLDGLFVPVFGWRRDEVSNISTSAPKDPISSIASMDYMIDQAVTPTNTAAGESKSWGGVLHMPKSWSEKLPGNTSISLFYNRSSNFKADAPRGDVFGNIIANPAGQTKDYGFVLTTLNDKLSLKVNWYETKLSNATLSADSAGFSGSLYYIWAVPAWEATFALANREGLAGRNDGRQWYWNYAGRAADGEYGSVQPGTPGYDTNPEVVKQKAAINDFLQNFPFGPEFFDAYGIDIDVTKFKSANPLTAWPGYNPDNLAIQPAYQGRLKSTGAGPVASVDTASEGIEFELTAKPLKNWNLTLNASKTTASRIALSPTIVSFMDTYTKFLAGPAGDLRLWGTDPNNSFRNYWRDNIVAPYKVLRAQEGSSAPEIAPWRFNLISTYSFDEGRLKGGYIGGAYRWEDKRIIGYQYSTTAGTLDISKPYYGPTDKHFDLWFGYSRKLTEKINWRGQVNVRNVGESTGLVPVSVQPDGTRGLSRISEGMSWQLSNTFEF
ncbi:TonB-dependent receptor plug domain-containing protein [Oleiharenicola lentus]|nr:TonB-dependent receptor plug domain-containing protein [Oleiharenicola lentus]